MENLTQSEVDDLKEAFLLWDVEKKGSLDKAAVKAACRQMDVKVTDAEVSQMLKEAGGGDKIEFDGFVKMFARRLKGGTDSDKIALAFSCYDTQGRGYLEVEKLKEVVRESKAMTADEMREFVKFASPDEDGMIDYEQLAKKMSSTGF